MSGFSDGFRPERFFGRAMVLLRADVFWEAFLAANRFRSFFEFGDFFVLPDFWTGAFFAVFRAAFDFVFFAIAILPDI